MVVAKNFESPGPIGKNTCAFHAGEMNERVSHGDGDLNFIVDHRKSKRPQSRKGSWIAYSVHVHGQVTLTIYGNRNLPPYAFSSIPSFTA